LKKALLCLVAVTFLALLLIPFASSALTVQVSVGNPSIGPGQSQTITASAFEKGTGILFVVQPGVPTQNWKSLLDANPFLKSYWSKIPVNLQTQISTEIGNGVVSCEVVSLNTPTSTGPHQPPVYSQTVNFPKDFTGLNGVPNTQMAGTYKVIFAFIGWDNSCYQSQINFACGQWFVLAESPLGTATGVIAPLAAVGAFGAYKKLSAKKHL